MRNLISALQFITILPLGKGKSFDPPKMVPYFPLVGILLGLLVAGFDAMIVRFWAPPVVALLDIILLAVLTGAFTLMGWEILPTVFWGRVPGIKRLRS